MFACICLYVYVHSTIVRACVCSYIQTILYLYRDALHMHMYIVHMYTRRVIPSMYSNNAYARTYIRTYTFSASGRGGGVSLYGMNANATFVRSLVALNLALQYGGECGCGDGGGT